MYFSQGGISSTTASGATWTFTYDNCGNRTSMTDPDAGTSTYSYDALGREIYRLDARGAAVVTNYDYLGRITSTTDDQYGRMTKETLIGYETQYQYSDAGLVTRKTYPNSKVLDYTYDAYGNLMTTNAVNGAILWSRTGYSGSSSTSTVRLGNTTAFTRTTQLDAYGNLQSVQLSRGATTLRSDSYTFSSSTGNLTSRTLGGVTQGFSYDGMDRLTEVTSGGQTQMEMDYLSNGNISYKTGIGLYEYNSNSKPHAVAAVANTSGLIPEGEQIVLYNYWGKISDVYSTVGSDTYHYIIHYGPDLQRVFTELWKNDTEFLHFTFYDGGFEQRYENGQINNTYCIDGAAGTEALYMEHTQTGVKTYCIETDHLGSITGLYNQNGTKVFSASYDVWGRRTVGSGSITFDRGFTGHEHLDQLGLIDMNGRMYDPLLGRFLSPDPFVQSPSDPQNYNRYSYCLNNPLKYTDPSGEFVWAPILIAAAIGGVQGTMLGIQNGAEGWDMVGYVVGGAALGALSGGITAAAFGGDFWDGALNGAIMGGLSGMAFGAYRGWTNASTLGVNHWTGGTLQERAQAWADYYGLPREMFNYASQDNLDVVSQGKDYSYYSQYDGITAIRNSDGKILYYKIDGLCTESRDNIFLSAKTIRHARFNTGWGKGSYFHEYYHSQNENTYRDELGAYQTGYGYGGRRYYGHRKSEMKLYGISR